jgi:hypothetical protein
MADEADAVGALPGAAGAEGLVAGGASGSSGDVGTGGGALVIAVVGDAGTTAAADGDAFAPVAAGGATGVEIIAWLAVAAAGTVGAIAGDGVGAAPGGVDGGATMLSIFDEVTGVMPDGAMGAVIGTAEELVGPVAVAASCGDGAGLAALRAGTGATS